MLFYSTCFFFFSFIKMFYFTGQSSVFFLSFFLPFLVSYFHKKCKFIFSIYKAAKRLWIQQKQKLKIEEREEGNCSVVVCLMVNKNFFYSLAYFFHLI